MLKILPALALLWAAVAAPGADVPATFKVGEYTFTRPAGWAWIKSTHGMSKAHLKLTNISNGKSADVHFSYDTLGIDYVRRLMTDPLVAAIATNNSHRPIPTVVTNAAGHKLTFMDPGSAAERGKPSDVALLQPATKVVYAFMESKESRVVAMFSGSKELVDVSEAQFRKMIETAFAGK